MDFGMFALEALETTNEIKGSGRSEVLVDTFELW